MNKPTMRKRPALLFGLALIGLLFVSSCGSEEPENLEKVVFMAGFKAQANLPFVAAYVAKEQGYFRDQGLDVEIRHANTGGHLQLLMSGDVDFTTAAAASVLNRRSDPSLPVVAFVLWGQKGQQAYVALKDSGINTIKDWEGKTFGYHISPPPDYLALLKANNVDRSTITEVDAGFDPRVLTEGRVDILAVFKSNEPDTIRGLGFELNMWDPADHSVPTLGLTYITRQDVIDVQPDRVTRFLKATLKAAEFIQENNEKALDIVMKYAPNEKRDHQKFMLKAELRDAFGPVTNREGIGWFTDEQWQALYDQLLEFEALPKPFDFRTAYTDQFLTAIHERHRLLWP